MRLPAIIIFELPMQGSDLTKLASYDYHLPEDLIAKRPLDNREEARLLVVDRKEGKFTDARVADLHRYFQPEDQLVFNDTKVIPARLRGRRETGGEAEALIHTPNPDGSWWALTRPARKLTVGQRLHLSQESYLEVVEEGDAGQRRLSLKGPLSLMEALEKHGEVPLPHYLRRGQEESDKTNYQTIYARYPGAVAAPTAGFHFTENLMEKLEAKGVERVYVTLHVGLGTFQPVAVEDIRSHPMHSERFVIPSHSAEAMNRKPRTSKRYCIGTTSVRTVESMVDENGRIKAGESQTNLFIYPGYSFKAVDGLLTNFHVPKSTLLMLVSAFAGYDLIKEAYAHAVKEKYRFYSYGDAMLIL